MFSEISLSKNLLKLTEEIPNGKEFDCVLGIRPELVNITTKDPKSSEFIEAAVYASQPAGAETIVTLDTKGTQYLALQVDLRKYDMNQKVWISVDPKRINVFNKQTTRLIRYAETRDKSEYSDSI